jgi:capsular exopolysaccharide synthesis family protein
MLSSSAGPPQVLLVTSPAPREGKTVTSVNLAIAMAQAGASVLLIDGDFRRPQVHLFFGARNEEGFSNYLTGNSALEGTIRNTPIPNLKIMTSGPIPPNPAELLSSARLAEALTSLRKEFKAILFDSPPVAVVTDPILLSQLVDGTILVIKSGQTAREVSRMAKEQLQAANAPILGVVLNDVELNREGYYYHYYGRYYHRYYGPEDGDKAGTKKAKAKDKAKVEVEAKERPG